MDHGTQSRIGGTSCGRVNSLGISGHDLDRTLESIELGKTEVSAKGRSFVRHPFRLDKVHMRVKREGSGTNIRVACRNLSRGGISVLHNAYVHPDTPVAMVLPHVTDGPKLIEGVVRRCRYVRSTIHEVGIEFLKPIKVSDFLQADPFSDWYSLETVDPTSLVGTVVLVDSSELDRRVVEHFLRRTQLRIRTAKGVEDAIAKIKEGCDLVISEFSLGEKTGRDLIASMWEIGSHTPVILTTCDASEGAKARMTASGADAYLLKPMDESLLLRAAAEFLIVQRDCRKQANDSRRAADLPPALLDSFTEELSRMAGELDEAMAADDVERCRGLAMRLQSSAATFGFAALGRLAAESAGCLTAGGSVESSTDQLQALLDACRSPVRG